MANDPKAPKPLPLHVGNLWYLRAKANRGVQEFLIVADSKQQAEAVGRAFLDKIAHPTTYIGVEAAVVATPEILTQKPEPETVDAA